MPNESATSGVFWIFSSTDQIMVVSVLVALIVPFILIGLQAIYEWWKKRRNATNAAGCLAGELAAVLVETEQALRNFKPITRSVCRGVIREYQRHLIPVSHRLRTHADWIYLVSRTTAGRISFGIALMEMYNKSLESYGLTQIQASEALLDNLVRRLKMSRRHLKPAFEDLKKKYPKINDVYIRENSEE